MWGTEQCLRCYTLNICACSNLMHHYWSQDQLEPIAVGVNGVKPVTSTEKTLQWQRKKMENEGKWKNLVLSCCLGGLLRSSSLEVFSVYLFTAATIVVLLLSRGSFGMLCIYWAQPVGAKMLAAIYQWPTVLFLSLLTVMHQPVCQFPSHSLSVHFHSCKAQKIDRTSCRTEKARFI